MKRCLCACWLLVLLASQPQSAQAHALDQLFQDMRVQVQPTQIVLTVHLIAGPLITPRLWEQLDADNSHTLDQTEIERWCTEFNRKLELGFDQQPLQLSLYEISEFPINKADFIGSNATNLTWTVHAPLGSIAPGAHQLTLKSNNYHDISVVDWSKTRGRAGIVAQEASSMDLHSAQFPIKWPSSFRSDGAIALPSTEPSAAQPQPSSSLVARLQTGDNSFGLIAATLGLAFGFGAAHALQPGHGKTLVAAYLVGSRGTIRQATMLGAIVTLTHTASVFALGGLMLLFSAWVTPERFVPILTLISGVLVAGLGVRMLWERVQALRSGNQGHAHGGLFHSHADGAAGHSHVSNRKLLGLGISGGLVPCPEALVIMIVAATLGRIGLGFAMIIAFSAGLAAVLIGIGIVLVTLGSRLIKLSQPEARWVRWLPIASAGVVTLLGIGLMLQTF
ncbi:nickel/cobalt transporter [Herpetosiphon llansteffanensis]|uniref:nickel/cobalt transporter n=1 Tax=Herpetosiphon llansteffanensis TaxID=2094568 RepID=UPI000D7C97F2|nr:sulfite exporter TauE/SafE family protein [Herpetosiphon llansteffanensis]